MRDAGMRGWTGLLIWAAIALLGFFLIVRIDIAQRREAFQTDARIAHRLLSQRAAQHDAILATLVLLGPGLVGRGQPEQQLSAVQPQVVAVLRRDAGQVFDEAALRDAHTRSLASQRAELAGVDGAARRYTLVRAGEPSSFALVIDVPRMVPWDEWPIEQAGPVSVVLKLGDQALVIQAGEVLAAQPAGLTEGFVFSKAWATASQPFDLQLRRATGPAQWPWPWLGAWAVLSALGMWLFLMLQQTRRARQRAETLLRVGQVSRLNAMGELAAGVAHELSQPLTAVMANTQAARRMIDDEPPELAAARQAMTQATAQARRAAEVVARLRRLVEAPAAASPAPQALRLDEVARGVLDLFEPEIRRLGVLASVVVAEGPLHDVQADPVALEQIVHNLVGNAMHALQNTAQGQRRLVLHVAIEGRRGARSAEGVLTVQDSGPGLPAEALTRVFEPFYTTREGGLGLGLSLCESLAHGMRGTLSVRNLEPHGAAFRLALPLADAQPPGLSTSPPAS